MKIRNITLATKWNKFIKVSDLQLNSEGLEQFLCFKEDITVMIFKQTDSESLWTKLVLS